MRNCTCCNRLIKTHTWPVIDNETVAVLIQGVRNIFQSTFTTFEIYKFPFLFQIPALHKAQTVPLQHMPSPARHLHVPGVHEAQPIGHQSQGSQRVHQPSPGSRHRPGDLRHPPGQRQRPRLQQDLSSGDQVGREARDAFFRCFLRTSRSDE